MGCCRPLSLTLSPLSPTWTSSGPLGTKERTAAAGGLMVPLQRRSKGRSPCKTLGPRKLPRTADLGARPAMPKVIRREADPGSLRSTRYLSPKTARKANREKEAIPCHLSERVRTLTVILRCLLLTRSCQISMIRGHSSQSKMRSSIVRTWRRSLMCSIKLIPK